MSTQSYQPSQQHPTGDVSATELVARIEALEAAVFGDTQKTGFQAGRQRVTNRQQQQTTAQA